MKNNVKAYRGLHKMTQQELADMVQVSRQTIISIECNRYTPSVLLAIKLAKAMGTQVGQLFELEALD